MNKSELSNLVITEVLSSARLTNIGGTKRLNSNRRAWAMVLKLEGKTVSLAKKAGEREAFLNTWGLL